MAGRLLFALLVADACSQGALNAPSASVALNTAAEQAPQTEPTSGLYPAVVGVESCDQYASEYPACLDGYAPADQRDQLQQALQRQIDGWKKAASGPGKASLPGSCAKALEVAAKKFGPLGCSFTGFEPLAGNTEVAAGGSTTPAPAGSGTTPPAGDEPTSTGRRYPAVVGVHVCDEYLWNYRQCINTKGPRKSRRKLLRALDQTAAEWKQSAEHSGKENLTPGCETALANARAQTKSWGCAL